MGFAYRTSVGAKLLSLTSLVGGNLETTDLDFLWDQGLLGSRERPTLNYEFEKRVRVKVK